MQTPFDLESFVQSYMTCALWSSVMCDEEGNDCRPLDDGFGTDDIAPECEAAMRASCKDFVDANRADLLAYCDTHDAGLAGHDFWLTRNGHGTGFWDHGLGELGQRLSDAAKVYGSVDLYPGDDGLIYGE